MARKKITPEKRFAEALDELGIENAQMVLNILKWEKDKKSPGTDPDPKARRRQMNSKTVSPPSDDSQQEKNK